MQFELKDEHKREIKDISKIAGILHSHGWAERNAGNISVHIQVNDSDRYDVTHTHKLPRVYKGLEGHSFIATGSGKRMRDIPASPHENLLIGTVREDLFHIIWPTGCDYYPTMEFNSHLALHSHNLSGGITHSVILHTHPDELIVLSHFASVKDSRSLNDILWRMHPETYPTIPDGIGLLPFQVPSSSPLEGGTRGLVGDHRLILWAKHGVVYVGDDLVKGLDIIECANKSARLYLLSRSTNERLDPLSDEDMAQLEDTLWDYIRPRMKHPRRRWGP